MNVRFDKTNDKAAGAGVSHMLQEHEYSWKLTWPREHGGHGRTMPIMVPGTGRTLVRPGYLFQGSVFGYRCQVTLLTAERPAEVERARALIQALDSMSGVSALQAAYDARAAELSGYFLTQ